MLTRSSPRITRTRSRSEHAVAQAWTVLRSRCKTIRMMVTLAALTSGPFLQSAFAAGLANPDHIATSLPDRAALALQSLMNRYAIKGRSDWQGLHAWQRFVTVSILSDYEIISGNTRFHTAALHALQNRHGLDGNDDDLWVAQADLDMARLTHTASQIQDARTIFDMIASQYWDGHCGGGVWWDHARTYKNAITNELFLNTAARLYHLTHDPAYKNWALKSWAWFRSSGLITADNLVNDGLNHQCLNNGGAPYSYNQGVILDGLLEISSLTNDGAPRQAASRIALSAIKTFTSFSGSFQEPGGTMNTDARIFRGVFVRALGHVAASEIDHTTRSMIADWLSQQAQFAWRIGKPGFRVSDTWSDHPFHISAQGQITAASLFLAIPLPQSVPTP
ncbi:glycoside hydrolase family 76 protein [Gluconobacter japonicus]|uniref:glycoside hydrolase family 76 protein n=1 Tax=Gluconobacter japonicus TaxID=376620 RepID=UPI000AE1E29A|nr:glycoside hydrolase family 76 protein [Gluconobacter japonicus]